MADSRLSDPYAPPTAELNAGIVAVPQVAELASRGTRLAAASLDGLLVAAPLAPALGFTAWQAIRMQAMVREAGMVGERAVQSPVTAGLAWVFVVFGAGMLMALAVCIYQWVLVTRTGQTLGKKWVGARIQKIDGSPVTFGSAVVIRGWVFRLVGAVPYLGWAFHVIDCLCIFREDRRCLHDHLAGTRVIRVQR